MVVWQSVFGLVDGQGCAFASLSTLVLRSSESTFDIDIYLLMHLLPYAMALQSSIILQSCIDVLVKEMESETNAHCLRRYLHTIMGASICSRRVDCSQTATIVKVSC